MRSYGRIHAHDSRDAKYSLHSLRSHRIERFWNGGHVLDQEHSNSCVGQAWAGWLLAPPISGQFLDPLGLYAMAGRFDAGDRFDAAGGTTVRNGAKVLKKLGFIESYHWAHDIDSLIYTLLEIGPMVVGTNWFEGMEEVGLNGRLTVSGKPAGGHAYLLDAIDLRDEMLRIKNSWGLDWGIGGRAWIAISDFERLLKEDGEACRAVEQRPQSIGAWHPLGKAA